MVRDLASCRWIDDKLNVIVGFSPADRRGGE
jgi:hypothetical protein